MQDCKPLWEVASHRHKAPVPFAHKCYPIHRPLRDEKMGGLRTARTSDLKISGPALNQLSYPCFDSPMVDACNGTTIIDIGLKLVELHPHSCVEMAV